MTNTKNERIKKLDRLREVIIGEKKLREERYSLEKELGIF